MLMSSVSFKLEGDGSSFTSTRYREERYDREAGEEPSGGFTTLNLLVELPSGAVSTLDGALGLLVLLVELVVGS